MTDTGIIRKLDALGRIVFPKELRDTFGWETGTKMQIYTEVILLFCYFPS